MYLCQTIIFFSFFTIKKLPSWSCGNAFGFRTISLLEFYPRLLKLSSDSSEYFSGFFFCLTAKIHYTYPLLNPRTTVTWFPLFFEPTPKYAPAWLISSSKSLSIWLNFYNNHKWLLPFFCRSFPCFCLGCSTGNHSISFFPGRSTSSTPTMNFVYLIILIAISHDICQPFLK